MAVGLLLAPRSGKSLRRKLGLELLRYKNELQDKTEESIHQLKDATNYAAMSLNKKARKKYRGHRFAKNGSWIKSLVS